MRTKPRRDTLVEFSIAIVSVVALGIALTVVSHGQNAAPGTPIFSETTGTHSVTLLERKVTDNISIFDLKYKGITAADASMLIAGAVNRLAKQRGYTFVANMGEKITDDSMSYYMAFFRVAPSNFQRLKQEFQKKYRLDGGGDTFIPVENE